MLTRRRARGQALVEFALVIPIFGLVFFGTVDGARLVYSDNQLSQAAREGARVAAVEASWVGTTTSQDPSCVASASLITSSNPGAHVCPATTAILKADVVSAANRMAVGMNLAAVDVYLACDAGSATDPAPTGPWTEASVTYPECSGGGVPNGSGNLVSVRIVYQFVPITPIVGQMIGSVSLSGSATLAISAGKAIP